MLELLSSGCIQYQIITFENNPDIRNHPRISPRIFAIIRKFWGRVGCEKINVRWGTSYSSLLMTSSNAKFSFFTDFTHDLGLERLTEISSE